ncbi:MAG: PIN domain-containing protein [Verrucomicrobiota bacterium]
MNVLLDSGVLVRLAGEMPDWVQGLNPADGVCGISVVTLDELLRSVSLSRAGADRARRMAFIEGLAEKFEIFPIDESIARVHAALREGLGRRSATLGLHEGWLASTCLAHSLMLLTDHSADYRMIRGLNVRKV